MSEEVIKLTGVRERLAAYKEATKKKDTVPKKKITVFQVEEGNASISGNSDDPLVQEDNDGSSSEDDEPMTPEKAARKEKEREAKQKLVEHIVVVDDSSGPITMQSFSALQKRYMGAVTTLKPKKIEIPQKSEKSLKEIKEELTKESTKIEHFESLKESWYIYSNAAQDNDKATVDDIQAEVEIEEMEDELVQEWGGFAEEAVETVEKVKAERKDEGDDSDDDTDDEMGKWRAEAKRLKAQAEERKAKKADKEKLRQERKKRAEEMAKRKEERRLRKKAREEEQERLDEENKKAQAKFDAAEAALHEKSAKDKQSMNDALRNAEDVAKRLLGVEIPPDEKEEEEEEAEKKSKDGSNTELDSDDEEAAKAKKKDRRLRRQSASKSKKDADKAKKNKDKKKKGGDDSDDEVNGPPRNLDGTLWKNPLKFWSNKPKTVKEVGGKYMLKTLPNTDCFRRSEKVTNDNPSFYWHKVDGDFDVLVRIKGEFASAYDKAGLLVRADDNNWVMSGFEYFNEMLNHSTSVTREITDWSLAPLPEEAKDGVWFCIKRQGTKIETFYSMDAKKWIQTRQALFSDAKTVKVGVAAACPVGESYKVVFDRFWLRPK